MSFTAGVNGPTYISSHSADVILSDIRPIKLKIEALRSINVLLDEFLYNILSAARSLSTDKLRAGLLKVLPTNLGKEALLEAEVELRAYWERTKLPGGAASPLLEEGQFHLQWSFELLRLKCEAYSTLNENDENLAAETSLNERMSSQAGFTTPKPSLVAPAALYLTAILEAMCEHVLGNVGRVASRDSSRTNATVQDLFVALCEDESIYGLFKTMKVYDQIEMLSQSSGHRRNKSFTRNADKSLSRTSSPQNDPPPTPPEPFTAPFKSRASSESASVHGDPFSSPPRTSTDKPKGVKKFIPGRSSHEESQNGHKRSESLYSSDSRAETEKFDAEDSALLQEFDDLMRSNATMKVSLTPDRLRTMEAHKREQKGNTRAPPPSFTPKVDPEPPTTHISRANGRRPSPRHVDSIVEDEEEGKTSPNMAIPSVSTPEPLQASRARSASAAVPSSTSEHSLPRKGSQVAMGTKYSPPVPSAPSTMSPKGFSKPFAMPDSDGRPTRTRKVQRNRESLDLDDVMGGSDDESIPVEPRPKPPMGAKRGPVPHKVSASTRDLIDFLAEGPPDLPEPPIATAASFDGSKPKGSGRLQRMMSKLSMGNSDKNKSSDSPVRPRRVTLQNKPSITSLSPLANKPVPPRPPPVSPPDSPPPTSFDEGPTSSIRSRVSTPRRTVSAWEQTQDNYSVKSGSDAIKVSQEANPPTPVVQPRLLNGSTVSRMVESDRVLNDVKKSRRASLLQRVPVPPVDPSMDQRSSSKSPASTPAPSTPEPTSRAPSAVPPEPKSKAEPEDPKPNGVAQASSTPHISATTAQHMQRLMANATNADECRLILHAVLVTSGIPADLVNNAPSPSANDVPAHPELEAALIELFLGNGPTGSSPQNASSTEQPANQEVNNASSRPGSRSAFAMADSAPPQTVLAPTSAVGA